MKWFDNFEEMQNAITKGGTNAVGAFFGSISQNLLLRDVSPIMKNILIKHITSDIYNAYTPKDHGWVSTTGGRRHRETYQRRHVLENSLYAFASNADEVMVTSKASPQNPIVAGCHFNNKVPGSFLKLLEVGNMGIWKGGFPRPAVRNAQSEIDTSKEIMNAIKRSIG